MNTNTGNKLNDLLSYERLMLNLHSPSLEDCWSEGYEAAESNEEESSNPYSMNSLEYEHWNQGWWAGFYGETRLYPRVEDTSETQIPSSDSANINAANEPFWVQAGTKTWASSVLKIAGSVAATIAIVELLELVV